MKLIIILTLILIVIFLTFPFILRRIIYKRCLSQLDKKNWDLYYQTLDSFLSKMSFSSFERENMRLSGLIAQDRNQDVHRQLHFMNHMRLSLKDKSIIEQRAFYYYMEIEEYKKAFDVLNTMRKHNHPSYHDLEIQYSILAKRESKYISELENKIKTIRNGDYLKHSMVVGTLEYLIGLQYMYKNEKESAKMYFNSSYQHDPQGAYSNQIQRLLSNL